MKLDFRQRLLASTLLATAGLIANPAYAQETQSTVPDQNQATNPGGAPPTGDVAASPTPTVSAQGEAVQQAQDIVVTGTRIPQPNLESAAPVTVVSNQDIKLSGLTRIDDVLNQLPSAAASQGPGLPNPATGTAEIDLRYLGAKRTLSLINGRRITPGDPNSSSQAGDVNVIPAFMVKRVEVLTGGASSVYGADAVAGVVNFIIDTDFSGLRLDGQISGYQHNNDCPSIGGGDTVCDELDRNIALGRNGYEYPHGSGWDGKSIDINAAFGAGFDDGRGHVMGYFGYRKQNAVTQDARDYSACTLNRGGALGTPPDGVACGGSPTSAIGTFFLFDDGPNTTTYQPGPNGTLVPGFTAFNYAPYNHWVRPDERYVGGVFADYEITPWAKPYLEFMFMDDQTQAQIAPSGDFGNTYTINCDNPFIQNATDIICDTPNLINGFVGTFPLAVGAGYSNIPEGTDPLTFFDARGNQYQSAYFNVLRRNVEGGPRQNNLKHTTFRGVIGTRGDLSNAFSYDAYYQYGKTNYSQVYKNEFSQARLVNALNAVNVDANGIVVPVGTPGSNIVCRSVINGTDPNCVPYDILGGPSAEAINYLNVYGVISGETREQIANINFTGQLGELGIQTPWANNGVGINVGYEYRREFLNLDPDALFQAGDLTGQGAATLPTNGKFHVNELFGEIQIPIVEHNFIDDLTLSAGYRHSSYKNSGNGVSNTYDTDTYKASIEFAPIADVRFRGSYNRASRAPNIVELFGVQTVALDGSTDPCAGKEITAADAGCIAQGLVVGQETPTNPAEQYNGFLGGDPNLVPEKATTKTVGVVLQPRFLPRFAFTVDYWNIKLEKAIQGFGADTIVADCTDNTTDANNPAASCALIHRDPAGSLWLSPNGFIIDLPSNSGRIKTDGFDFTAAYSHRFGGMGNLSFSFLGTALRHYKVLNGIAPEYDCAGYYGGVCSGNTVASSSAMPKWRSKLRTTWQSPFGLGLSLNWRMVGKVAFEANSDDVALSGSAAARGQLGSHVKAQHYFDLAATYSLWDMVNLRAGVNNIFDKSPPIIPTGSGSCPSAACTGNTYPQTWDYLGRFAYLGATVDFKHKVTPLAPPPVLAPPPPPPAAPATITCPDGLVILANQSCPALPPPPPPPAPAPERGL